MKPLIAYTSPSVEILEGRDVTLMCVVLLGNPPPKITWYKMGDRLAKHGAVANGNGHLVIDDVSVDDEGEYTCVASNAGGNATQAIQLDVHGRWSLLICLANWANSAFHPSGVGKWITGVETIERQRVHVWLYCCRPKSVSAG